MGTHYKGNTKQKQALDTFIKLMRCSDAVASRLAASLRGSGLTHSQFGVLETLLHLGPLHQNELGRKLLKSGGNITLVVDNLERLGLVKRQQDKADRRFTTVLLTAAGRRRIAELFPMQVEVIAAEMGRLSRTEQKQLSALCRKLGVRGND